jgi:hypothetical protein
MADFHFSNPAMMDHLYSYWGQDPEWESRLQVCGFEFGKFESNGFPAYQHIWVVPYASFVVPLTLLSSSLLMSKPRTSTPRKITESIPEKVA